MDTNTYRHWYDDEVRALLKIWCDAKTQRLLQRRCRNKDVYGMISEKLRTLGYQRDWTQCRVKIKNLKYEYRAAKDGTLRGGPSQMARCMRFFNDMDKVLSIGELPNAFKSVGGFDGTLDCNYPTWPQAATRDTSPLQTSARLAEVKKEITDEPELEIIEEGEEGNQEPTGISDQEFTETEGDSVSSMTNFLVAPVEPSTATATSASFSTPQYNSSEPIGQRLLPVQAISPPESIPTTPATAALCQQENDFRAIVEPEMTSPNGDDYSSSAFPPGPSAGAPEPSLQGSINKDTGLRAGGNKKRPRRADLGRTLERVTAMFLQHQRLSEVKYYRWEAHQRQLERLHELRLVSTIIQGLQTIANPPAASLSTVNGAMAPDTNME